MTLVVPGDPESPYSLRWALWRDGCAELRSHLNRYAYQALNQAEQRRLQQASEDGAGDDAYCAIFGPEKIPGELGSFLGYFMVRKVIARAGLLQAAGTVTKKLARWRHEHDVIDAETAAALTEQAADAARDRPGAARLSDLLTDISMRTPPPGIDENPVIEDRLALAVPKQASDVAQLGWEAFVALVEQRGRWWLLENGAAYP